MPYARREVVVDGVRLSVVDEGPQEAPTLLMLHGNPMWSFLYRKLVAPALKAGLRVVVPDHAGCGLSEKPSHPEYYTLQRHVDNLIGVARELDVRDATVVMHDWGGPIGMGFAVAAPERVRNLVACNTTVFAPTTPRSFTTWHRIFGSHAGFHAGVALNLVFASAIRFGVEKRLPRDVRRAYAWPMRERGGRIAAGRFVQMVPDGPDHPEAATMRAIEAGFPRLAGKPVHVLWADKDRVMGPRLAERWKRAPLDVVSVEHVAPQAGHFWQEDAPQAFLPGILDAARRA